MTRPTTLLLALSLGGAPGLAAQVTAHMDVGRGGTPWPRVGSSTHWSVAPGIDWATARSRVALAGEYRDFGDRGRGATGFATASWYAPMAQPLTLEVLAEGRGQAGTGLTSRGAWDAGTRLHLVGAHQGAWVGSRLGADASGGTFQWEAAFWRRLGSFSLQLQGRQSTQSVGAVTTGGGPLDTLPGGPDTLSSRTGTETRVLTDLGSWLSWNGRRLQVTAAGGVRLGSYQPAVSPTDPGAPDFGQGARQRSATEGWWLGEVTYWMTDRFALAGSMGRHVGDPSLLAPSGRFLRLSLRAAIGRRGPPSTAPRVATTVGLRCRRVTTALVEFSLEAPAASRVELIGDFTDWVPVDLVRSAGGRWSVRIPAAAGLHRVNVRYDGGAWQPPPGTRVVQDEFEGTSGVLVVG